MSAKTSDHLIVFCKQQIGRRGRKVSYSKWLETVVKQGGGRFWGREISTIGPGLCGSPQAGENFGLGNLAAAPRAPETLTTRQNNACAHLRAMVSAMGTAVIARWRLKLTSPNPTLTLTQPF
jgi:hypothetical protein